MYIFVVNLYIFSDMMIKDIHFSFVCGVCSIISEPDYNVLFNLTERVFLT